MKAILMSIKPKYVADILNGRKTIEIRKTMPKCDLPIDVYIYCTKDNVETLFKLREQLGKEYYDYACLSKKGKDYNLFLTDINLNGKVVAKFTLNKVEEIRRFMCGDFYHKDICLTTHELNNYLGFRGYGYGWHISNLEIFDKPKKLSEFMTPKSYQQYQRDLKKAYKDDEKTLSRLYSGCAFENECANCVELIEMTKDCYGLKKPPKSWCYVEVQE